MPSKINKTLARKERRRARDREEVLEVAVQLFAEQGFNRTGMAEVADAADCSVGKLYTLFANKEALFMALVTDRMRRLGRASNDAVSSDAPPLDQLRQRLRGALDFFVDDPHFSRIFQNEFPHQAEGVLQQEMVYHQTVVRECLEKAMAAGQILQEDPAPLAALIVSAIDGLIELSETRDEPLSSDWVLDYIDRFYLNPLEAAASDVRN